MVTTLHTEGELRGWLLYFRWREAQRRQRELEARVERDLRSRMGGRPAPRS